MARLREMGFVVSWDWTEKSVSPAEEALLDMAGVQAADVVVVILDADLPYRGTWVELGAALALGKPVYVIGHAQDGLCIFLSHPLVRHDLEEEEVYNELRRARSNHPSGA